MTTLAFISGLLSGVVLGVLALTELIKWTFRSNADWRDRVRVWLAACDGYPFVRCPNCEAIFSTAPDEDEDTEP